MPQHINKTSGNLIKERQKSQDGKVPPGHGSKNSRKNTSKGPLSRSIERESFEQNQGSDDVLNITDGSNLKYSNKEIVSNWQKYEIPIESYDEIEEQENLGADYEKLVQAPVSAGSHFQFKHEKSWKTETLPSELDKYFSINDEILSTAIMTIPFYERNDINTSVFSETELSNMNKKATVAKQKYYNDKSYTTPELEINERIKNLLAGTEEAKEDTSGKKHTTPKTNPGSEELLGSDMESKGRLKSGAESTSDKDSKVKVKTNPASLCNVPEEKSAEDLEKWLDEFLDTN